MNRQQRRAQKRAERATWAVFADTVAVTIGKGTDLHNAARKAAGGNQGAAERFYELLEDLPVGARDRLLARLQAMDANRRAVAMQYARSGRV